MITSTPLINNSTTNNNDNKMYVCIYIYTIHDYGLSWLKTLVLGWYPKIAWVWLKHP